MAPSPFLQTTLHKEVVVVYESYILSPRQLYATVASGRNPLVLMCLHSEPLWKLALKSLEDLRTAVGTAVVDTNNKFCIFLVLDYFITTSSLSITYLLLMQSIMAVNLT